MININEFNNKYKWKTKECKDKKKYFWYLNAIYEGQEFS